MQDLRNGLLKLLIAINFEGDKEAFVSEFIGLCHAQALRTLFESLPHDTQQQITSETKQKGDSMFETILSGYVTPQQYSQALQNAVQENVESVLAHILPDLDQKDLEMLDTVFAVSP